MQKLHSCLAALILLALAGLLPALANNAVLRPVDEGSKHPAFFQFRRELMQIVKQKDTKALLRHLDADIKCSFGGCNDLAAFLAFWKLDKDPDQSELWQELKGVLELGGTFVEVPDRDGKQYLSFTAPYVFAAFPEGFDAYTHAAILKENVHVRARPSSQSRSIDLLSHNIVEIVYQDAEKLVWETIQGEHHYWEKIKTPSGETGYVFSQYIRKAIDYRAIFSNETGSWKMRVFVAGD